MKENGKSKVLLIDDIKADINILNNALNDEYELDFALNGEDGLRRVESCPPDLILLDIVMPGMNGYEVCERLKADDRIRNIPVIFMTSKSEEGDETKGFELGAVDYLTKPFSMPIVKARLHTHLKIQKLIDDLQISLAEVTQLNGFLPICANCKKIRDDEGYWEQIEKYIQEHSEAQFTHSICPDCTRKLYPEIDMDESIRPTVLSLRQQEDKQ